MTEPGAVADLDPRIEELAQQAVVLGTANSADHRSLEALNRLKHRWQTPRVPCVVAGEINSGKTTLINALLGEALLPTDSRAWTSTWVRLHHAPAFTAVAVLRIDGQLRTIPLTRDVLPTYLTVGGTKTVHRWHGPDATVVSVDIGVPVPLLETGLELLDTPGVNGLNNAHLLAARTGLVRADAVLFVSRPGTPISATERTFLAEATERVSTCVLVFTHRDGQDDPDESVRQDLAAVTDAGQWTALLGDAVTAEDTARRFKAVTAVSVSSKNRLKAAGLPAGARRDRLDAASNFGEFEDVLAHDVVGQAGRIHRRNIVRLCRLLAEDVARRARLRRELFLDDEAAVVALDRREQAIKRWADHNGDSWKPAFARDCDTLVENLGELAGRRSRELNREYRSALLSMSRNDMRAVLDTLEQTPALVLADLLDQSRRTIAAAVERIRGLLAADDLDAPLQRMLAAQDVEGRIPAPPPIDRTAAPGAAEVRAALLGGMTGAGAAGLAVPALAKLGYLTVAAVPVLWPAVVGAALFGGLQWAQNNRQRAATDAVLFLDEVRACLTGPTLAEATRVTRAAAAAITSQISELLDEQQREVEATRAALAEARTLQADPAERRARIDQLDALIEQAGRLRAAATRLAQDLD